MKKVLVVNCGSSSIKYALYEGKQVLVEGVMEQVKNYDLKLRQILKEIVKSGKVGSLREIKAVGHRVVHGGRISKAQVINKKVMEVIKKNSVFAPTHNPHNLQGIKILQKLLPVPQIAVFDTRRDR